jgi:GNAT superfamily N-acetyltransferase
VSSAKHSREKDPARSEKVLIRPFAEIDIPAMAAIRALEWETEAYWTRRIALYLGGEHSPRHASSDRAAFVAIAGNEMAGFVAGHRTRRYKCDGELQWINVAPLQRGRGIADQLIARMGAWFVEQNAVRICVDVQPQNIAARKLYARCGAQPLNPHWMVWEDSRRMSQGAQEQNTGNFQ